jgi:hypothetical protein
MPPILSELATMANLLNTLETATSKLRADIRDLLISPAGVAVTVNTTVISVKLSWYDPTTA